MQPPDYITHSRLRTVWELCAAALPRFELRFKNESRLMKLIGFFTGIFNPGFMTEYVTTIGPKVYFPSKTELVARQDLFSEVLAHEYVHLYDSKKNRLFSVLYLMPQALGCLSLLSLFAVWDVRALWFLLALLFLAPIPAPWRTYYELRGYCMSMLAEYIDTGDIHPATITWAMVQFTGSSYYWMWPFRTYVYGKLKEQAALIKAGGLPNIGDPGPYVAMRAAMNLSRRNYH